MIEAADFSRLSLTMRKIIVKFVIFPGKILFMRESLNITVLVYVK